MMNRAKYLAGERHDVTVAVDVPTFADIVDSDRNRKTYVIPPGEAESQRLNAIRLARNPLLEAARPLLRAQADMPDTLTGPASELLRKMLEHELRIFHKLCEQANIRRDHMIGARYCLCTALDEAAMRTEWGRDGSSGCEWGNRSLATTFHEDRDGGEKVYLLIGRLLQAPDEHRDLLEVIYRVLSLGFEGRYQDGADGKRKHDAIRQRLYTEITSQRDPVPLTLSPHWQPSTKGKRPSFYDFPVWITATLLSVILLGLFGWFKYELSDHSADVQKQIADIARMTPPPVPPPQLHLKQLLKDEIAAGTVSVDEDARRSAVTFRGDAMFRPGGASVQASMNPLIAKIAAEIAKVPGKVTIVGYTDNVPIRSRQFASNQALSEERATQVMQMLQAAGVPANRLEAVGKGDADPVGDNRTAQGRAQNRRVEIDVAR
ncbi:type VI secretion system protein TssL, long form [Burkholderia multivorans]|uniref:type VI secretion system protein TssL, long form n=1 Tax=Burkholderia multivorans TaxID=87883 RepID=UPI0021BEA324|nr:type VI secretion system protein TssL, long form [Burkholderia multivorans]MDR8763469.1 putative lipoprotein YiaD [Burkholderia multivorans]MDR8769297.1 putative lipoprotein YiaD [Burkholderia multivorans]MDR8774668.1 putative lipoprotein YiaD [Burkholderia multivorans]MDR8792985.1 putative lipoprotein YiaD [Burkholderia multivorans]MDR8798833.1 putative lipoprotein YiaD [Burkholderia multivorans]